MRVASVQVVIPVHNEEERLAACLSSVEVATRTLLEVQPEMMTRTVVVLDRCTDRSEEIASRAGVAMVRLGAGSVGAARRVGVSRVIVPVGLTADQVWVASTDADTVVCPQWLVDQVTLADLGNDLVLGRVQPDPTELTGRALALWHEQHSHDGEHVHGANLGVRLSTYLAAGGFPPISEHEDVALAKAVQAAGRRWATGSFATTSARTDGRTPGGFAGYVRNLTLTLGAEQVP